MNSKIFRDIYVQLQTIGILDDSGAMKHSYMKFEASGLMDLHVDRLTATRISVAHNGLLNGDVMADPDVEIIIYPESKTAEGVTFQNDYLGIYQEPEDTKELNVFLHEWLSNIIDAKYELVEQEE